MISKTKKSVVVLCKSEGGHFPGLMLWAAGESYYMFSIVRKPISAHMNAHEAHMSESWAYIPII